MGFFCGNFSAGRVARIFTGGDIINYNEVVKISVAYLLPLVSELYGLEGYEINPVKAHNGGRNVVYTCEKEGTDAKILRIAFLNDRSREDFLGELEYVRYLFEHGGIVSIELKRLFLIEIHFFWSIKFWKLLRERKQLELKM